MTKDIDSETECLQHQDKRKYPVKYFSLKLTALAIFKHFEIHSSTILSTLIIFFLIKKRKRMLIKRRCLSRRDAPGIPTFKNVKGLLLLNGISDRLVFGNLLSLMPSLSFFIPLFYYLSVFIRMERINRVGIVTNETNYNRLLFIDIYL